jgi:hypothetical protein
MDDDFTDNMAPLPSKPRRTWLVRVGKIIRFVFIACLAAILASISLFVGNQPLGTITLNQLLGSLICLGLALGCLRWMFNSIEEDVAKSWAIRTGSITALIFLAAALTFFAMLVWSHWPK